MSKITLFCTLEELIDVQTKGRDDKLIDMIKKLDQSQVDTVMMSSYLPSEAKQMAEDTSIKCKAVIDTGMSALHEFMNNKQNGFTDEKRAKSIFFDNTLFWVKAAEGKGLQGIHGNFKDPDNVNKLQETLEKVGYKKPVLDPV